MVRNLADGGNRGEPLSAFHTYCLNTLGVPHEARPLAGEHHAGQHGYTIRSASGAVLWPTFEQHVR